MERRCVRERHFAILGEAFDASSQANGGNSGIAVAGGIADGQNGTNSDIVGNGGEAIGPGAEGDGANGHKGGVAIGAGSEADGGGDALDAGHTHSGRSIAKGPRCFNQPGK